MEEDIKILEQFLIGNKYCEDCKEKCVDCYIEYEEVQAVANLINRVKELEEAVDNFMQGKAYSTKQLEKLKKNFIPKSKIREKIEDLKQNNNGDDYNLTNVIMILQELLEDK